MPKKKRIPDEMPSDELLMAAIERAEIHSGRDEPGVLLANAACHLGLPFHSGTSRRLRPKLAALQSAGLVEPLRRHSLDLWTVTSAGRDRLNAVRAEIGPLPEAPQHKAWREARAAAGERIAGFRGDVRGALDEAIDLLEADREASSATWFEFADRLHESCGRLASAIHCLREWPEPDDSRPDRDDEPPYNRRGRRSTRGWDEY